MITRNFRKMGSNLFQTKLHSHLLDIWALQTLRIGQFLHRSIIHRTTLKWRVPMILIYLKSIKSWGINFLFANNSLGLQIWVWLATQELHCRLFKPHLIILGRNFCLRKAHTQINWRNCTRTPLFSRIYMTKMIPVKHSLNLFQNNRGVPILTSNYHETQHVESV